MADDRPTDDGELRPESRAIRAGRAAHQDSVGPPLWPMTAAPLSRSSASFCFFAAGMGGGAG